MALINAASAITAKARSRYGNRLREKDYHALVRCASVGEVVQYLKTYTHFQRSLDKISSDIHRGNLENILRKKQFESFLTLCKYNAGSTPVTEFLLRRSEIHELMKFITLLSIGRPQEYLFALPLYFTQHTDIRLEKLSAVHSHSELLAVLEHTDYYKLLKNYPPDDSGDYDLAAIEDALENEILRRLYVDLGHIKNKKERTQLISLFDTLADYRNYSRIIRLKKYYHMNNAAIRDHLLHYGSLTGHRLDRLLARESYEEVSAALRQTSVGRQAQKIDFHSEMAVQGRYNRCRHELYFSTNPEIVLLAYCILSEAELSNVVAIVEGVRYSMDPEAIAETLIL